MEKRIDISLLMNRKSVKAVPYRNNSQDNASERFNNIVDSLKADRLISLIIEPTSHCDLKCGFCGMHSSSHNLDSVGGGKVGRKTKAHMTMHDFELLVSKMTGFPPLKFLHFSGHGEPLLNKHLPDMIALAKEKSIASQIVVLTNGTLLTAEKLLTLNSAGVDEVRFGLDAISSEAYLQMKGADKSKQVKKNLAECLDVIVSHKLNIRLMIDCIRLSSPLASGGYGEEELIAKEFGDVIESTPGVTLRWREEINWVGQMGHGKPPVRTLPCEYPFYVILVHADGAISSCCADTSKQFVIADIQNIRSFMDVIKSENLRQLRKSLLMLDFENLQQCKRCDFRSVVDNELLEKADVLLNILE